jgi:hypothetical protein
MHKKVTTWAISSGVTIPPSRTVDQGSFSKNGKG